MTTTILEALFDYFGASPLLEGGRLHIDWLPAGTAAEGVEYAISTTPGEEELERYLSGGALCRYSFTISSVNDYGADEAQNLLNSGFYERFAQWLRAESKAQRLPVLPAGQTARSIRALGPGYLFQPDLGVGKYQIQCELVYYKKG